MVRMQHISKRFAEKQVLTDFSRGIPTGITCLMGASGAGKTTLLRVLLGLEKPDAGRVENMSARAAVVFQEDRLQDSMTVRGNLKLSLGKHYDEKAAAALLDDLLLADVLNEPVSALSGGMKRRVALCRALLYNAELLVLDEPFKGLDENTRQTVMDVVRRHAQGKKVLLVTHDEAEGRYLGARMVTMA